jgi:hypothetical protein
MTTYVEARDTIVAHLESTLSAFPRFYEDTETVDLDAVGDQFLKICIEFADAHQATIGTNPIDRTLGFIVISVFAKEGTGTRSTFQVFDTIKQSTKFRNLLKVQLETPRPGNVEPKNGWVNREILVPFWFDSNS